ADEPPRRHGATKPRRTSSPRRRGSRRFSRGAVCSGFPPGAGMTNSCITRAVEILRAGGLVGFPTETVYGLGADASNPEAVKKIYAAKGRPRNHPLIVHVAHAQEAAAWAAHFPASAQRLAERYWPGPLTL